MKLFCRVGLYVLGIFMLAMGNALSAQVGLGVSPVNALPLVFSAALKTDLGICASGVFIGYMLLQIPLLGKEYRWYNLTQIFVSLLFGYFVSWTGRFWAQFEFVSYPARLAMMLLSIGFVAGGVSFYMSARMIDMPPEGLVRALCETVLKRKSFPQVKVWFDCAGLVLAAVLSLLLMGRLVGIREGTVLSALLCGRLMKPIQRLIAPAVERFCFPVNDGDGETGDETTEISA